MKNIIKLIEPVYQNRFLLNFPEEFGLDSYTVSKISPLKYKADRGWKNIVITLFDVTGVQATKKLVESIGIGVNHLRTYMIEKIDPTGASAERIFIDSNLVEIDFGKFDYASEEWNSINLIIHPVRVIIQ
jgi:hypothetical protein